MLPLNRRITPASLPPPSTAGLMCRPRTCAARGYAAPPAADWVTEGFDTRDLQEAKPPLEALP
jgi:hypothetical protein